MARSVAVGLPGHLAARRLTVAPAAVRAARRRDRPADEWIGRTTGEAAFHRVLPGQSAAIIWPDLRAPAWAVRPELGQRFWPRPDSVNRRLQLHPLVLVVVRPRLWSWPEPLGLGLAPGRARLTIVLSVLLRRRRLLRRQLGRQLRKRRLSKRRLLRRWLRYRGLLRLGMRGKRLGRLGRLGRLRLGGLADLIRALLRRPARSLRNHRPDRLHSAERREPLVSVDVRAVGGSTVRRRPSRRAIASVD